MKEIDIILTLAKSVINKTDGGRGLSNAEKAAIDAAFALTGDKKLSDITLYKPW